MVAFTYDQLGEYIGLQSPYAQPGDTVLPNFATPVASGIIIQDKVNYFWDFRHAFPWDQEPGNPHRPLKVQNYQIIKAMLIPYTYTRFLDVSYGGIVETSGGSSPLASPSRLGIEISSHLLVGYTVAVPVPAHEHPNSPPLTPGDDYERLGVFIRDQTPFVTALPGLLADEADRYTLEIGVSWLATLSAVRTSEGRNVLKSTSDPEMDLIQEQQCYNWDAVVPQSPIGGSTTGATYGAGATPIPHPNPQFPPPPAAGANWMRNFQVSKAIRVVYRAMALTDPNDSNSPTQLVEGEVLIGFTGGGGM